MRPAEVNLLVGDPTKAKTEPNWNHKYKVGSLMANMVEADLRRYPKLEKNQAIYSKSYSLPYLIKVWKKEMCGEVQT